jgi:anti-sigma-K factor RskA
MIDPKAYIESGKLEEYVLGVGSTDLMQEVECMARVFPEIKEEIKALQSSLEFEAEISAVTPSPDLKNKILHRIKDESSGAPALEPSRDLPASGNQPQENSNTFTKWLLALMALSTLFFAYKSCNQKDQIQKVNQESSSRQTAMIQTVDSLNHFISTLQAELNIIKNPDAVAIKMSGTKLFPSGLATIYWNKNDQTVYMHPGNLPKAPTGKQFQLWGIIEGIPVSLGLIDSALTSFQSMKSAAQVSTFAVTLEPAGGSTNPTLDQMYVAGNVSQ